jgi:hypothetical protein
MTARPAATSTSPATQTLRAPKRAASFGVIRAVGIIAADNGSTDSAARSGLSPRTPCRYCSATNVKPKNAKNWMKIDRLPADRPGLRKCRGSSIG